MKKIYFNIMTTLMVTILSIGFISCNNDDDNGNDSDFVLIGEWQECESNGVFRDDATDYEVMHLQFLSDGTGNWWSVSNGKKDSYKYSFNYSSSINGTSGTITIIITSSTRSSNINHSSSLYVSYKNGILRIGDIYYKKK